MRQSRREFLGSLGVFSAWALVGVPALGSSAGERLSVESVRWLRQTAHSGTRSVIGITVRLSDGREWRHGFSSGPGWLDGDAFEKAMAPHIVELVLDAMDRANVGLNAIEASRAMRAAWPPAPIETY